MISVQPAILVADSDERRQGALRLLCRAKGWGCKVVTDAQEFKQLIEAGTFDLVIADVEMPGLDYKVLLGEACRRRPSQLLVVVGDSKGDDSDVRLLRGNETDVIARPVDLAWVERCMEQATISKRQETREQLAYSFVVSERTEMHFSCKQLGEAQAISLPIVARLVASRRLSETDALKIRLAVQEALLNAFEHGNLELDSRWKEEQSGATDKFSAIRKERLADPYFADRMVSVTSWFDGDTIEIVVKDQGRGFIPTHHKDVKKNDLSCFGRGLTLMSNAVDEVRFGCGGSEVTLIKHLAAKRST
jgi:DNA-binding response OmpR family regulator